ncbi:uncharacterized protein [Ptychodera flava]|uniref:uncharacterized protein n=1 Tax=Ptychodera flava TaxID=63121 RepID=UPI00396A5BEF
MNSIHTHVKPGSDIHMKCPDGKQVITSAPPVILLGTKKDLLQQGNSQSDSQDTDVEKEARKRLKEINEHLRKNATKAVNAHLVGMIAIDNKSRNKDSEMEKLRKCIQDYAMEYFFLGEVPVKWIRLELSMRQLRKQKIALEEAKAIGEKLEMTKKEISDALAFFHSVGEILHFTSIPELKDTIILDVVWLVNLFTILINQSLTYKEQVEYVPPKVCSLIDELHHEGRLHEELLDYLLKRHDRLQDKAVLLATMEMYDILFRMPERNVDTPCTTYRASYEEMLGEKWCRLSGWKHIMYSYLFPFSWKFPARRTFLSSGSPLLEEMA